MSLEKSIEEVIKTVIYHARHFSPSRDEIVVEKTVRFIMGLMEEGKAQETKRKKWAYGKYHKDYKDKKC